MVTEKPIFHLKDNYYDGSHPWYYDTNDYKWVKSIEENWHLVRDEIVSTLSEKDQIINNPLQHGVSRPGAWKYIHLLFFGWERKQNIKKFPVTWSVFTKNVPGLIFLTISTLDKNAEVLPHYSDTNTNLRCHLGIKIPSPLPLCGIKVGNEERSWEEGKVIMFSDCHQHSVWNHSNENRIVIVFDVLKKEYSHNQNWMCAQYLGLQTLCMIDSKLSFRQKTPITILKVLHFLSSVPWLFYLILSKKKTNFFKTI